MVVLKYLAILNASVIDGLYLPFSIDITVCRDTPRASPSSSCRRFWDFLNSSNRFFKSSPLKVTAD